MTSWTSSGHDASIWSSIGWSAVLALNVASVIAAPMAIMTLCEAWTTRKVMLGIVSLVVAAGCTFHNVTNALDKVASSRSDIHGVHEKVHGDIQRLLEQRQNVKSSMDVMVQRSSGVSSDILDQDLTTLRMHEVFKRTKGCLPEQVTLPESRDWCAIYRGSLARQEAAQKAEELKNELRGIDTALATQGPSRADADPQVANLAAFLSITDQRMLAVWLNVKTALLVELIGTFGPMIVQQFMRMFRRQEDETPAEPGPRIAEVVRAIPQNVPGDNQLKAVMLLPAPEQHIEVFVRQRLVKGQEGDLPARALYEDYISWCAHDGREPLKQPVFGAALKNLGLEKYKRGTFFYKNLAITPDRSKLGKRA